jgi:hypothetical protein
MHKIGPYFPTQPFQASPAFAAWLDLYIDGKPIPDKQNLTEMMHMHGRYLAAQAQAKARAEARQAS